MSTFFLMSWVSRIRTHKDPKRIPVSGHLVAKYEVMNFLPLILVVLSVLALKLYLALTDPVLRAIDPWVWASTVESYPQGLTIPYNPYPRGYQLLATLIAVATGTSGYEVVRFYPIVAALNLIPMYLLSFLISKSHRVATVTIILVTISKWYSIRTSVGNPECFTHFWFAFSMVFLLLLRNQPTRRNIGASIVFLTVTVLFWQFPIAIYSIFIPLLCIVNMRNRSYLKSLVLVTISSTIAAGSLWYFWVNPLWWVSWARAVGVFSLPTVPSTSPGLVESWGYVLLFLGFIGFVYIFGRRASRRDPSHVFLVALFFSTLALDVASLLSRTEWLVYYAFSSSALPISILAAIGLVAAVDAATPSLEMWTATLPRLFGRMKGKWSRTLFLLAIIIVLVGSSSPTNYRGDTVYKYWYEPVYYDQIVGVRIPLLDEQGSRWIATFQYGKSFDAPSNDLYSALTWIRNHSNKQSCVSAFLIRPSASNSPYTEPEPYSVLRRAFRTISERNLTEPTGFESLSLHSSIGFRSKILEACGGDVYFVTGIRSWSGEEWADTRLESRFLSCAAQSSELFPEVYSVGEVRVFQITREPVSSVAGASCQAGCDSYWMIRPRGGMG